MRTVRTILSVKGRTPESMEIGNSVSIEPDSTAMMPFIIEKTDVRKISVGHYYTRAGDVMSDPEIIFELDEQKWAPVRFTQDPNIEREDPAGLELGGFLATWDRNLRRQGYVDVIRE